MNLNNLFSFAVFTLATTFSFAGPQKIGIGIERLAFLGGASLNTLHGQNEIMPEASVGAGFGFNNDFDIIYLGGDFRYDLLKTNASALFAKANLGFVSGVNGVGADADNSGFSAATLAGFEYALTGNLKVSLAYGFQFMFGLGENTIGFTNNDAFGNFGIHWFL